MKAPETCLYCKGTGIADDANACGFCENGKSLDTQEDWGRSWGTLFERHSLPEARVKHTEGGSGGKRGHSNMTHWDKTREIKERTKRIRRRIDKLLTREED